MSTRLDEQRGERAETRAVRDRVQRLMPELKADLIRLAGIPSVTLPDFPTTPVLDAHDLVAELLRDAGVESVDPLSLPAPRRSSSRRRRVRRPFCSTRTTSRARR